MSADRKSLKVTCFQRALPINPDVSIDMVKNGYSPSTALLSSGRKEYSATKITAYFSPKPSPIASPQVASDAQDNIETNPQPKIEPKLETHDQFIGRVQHAKETKATSMPVATRKRSAQARAQPYPAPAPAQAQQAQQPLRAVRDARSKDIQLEDPSTPASLPIHARNATSAQANGYISLPRPLDRSHSPASDLLISNTPVNVKSVIFGDLMFDCSYSSRHVREIIGDKVAEGKEVLRMLCVCPHCFKYMEQIVQYIGHLPVCRLAEPLKVDDEDWTRSIASIERGSNVPGKRIYKHGEGWEVWEVDGEDEQLYCQNLSLFAKLFLGDKSVSFDVSSFIFYLLVHVTATPSSKCSEASPSTSTEDLTNGTASGAASESRQVIGFFSKEKQSWDSNNLACILIFPPWQRKGLGTILMGLSYYISRAEGLIGGPEKPLSELGKRSYIRYWGGEISRWLLNERQNDKISLDEVSTATFILKEDCIDALREMGVLEQGKTKKGEVKIDLQKVRKWVERTNTSLLPSLDPNGWCDTFYCRERVGSSDEEESE